MPLYQVVTPIKIRHDELEDVGADPVLGDGSQFAVGAVGGRPDGTLFADARKRFFYADDEDKMYRHDGAGASWVEILKKEPATSGGLVRLASIGPLTTTQSVLTFAGIPQTYRHLYLVVHGRTTGSITARELYLRFNGDVTASYDWQRMNAGGAAVGASEGFGDTEIHAGWAASGGAPASVAGMTEVLIFNYADAANFQKDCICRSHLKEGVTTGLLSIHMMAGWWRSVAAINQVSIEPSLNAFTGGSQATLFGIT